MVVPIHRAVRPWSRRKKKESILLNSSAETSRVDYDGLSIDTSTHLSEIVSSSPRLNLSPRNAITMVRSVYQRKLTTKKSKAKPERRNDDDSSTSDNDSTERLIAANERNHSSSRQSPPPMDSRALLSDSSCAKGFDLEQVQFSEDEENEEIPLWILYCGQQVADQPDEHDSGSLAYEPPPTTIEVPLEEFFASSSPQPLAAHRSLHDRIKEQRATRQRRRLNLGNLSTVEEMSQEDRSSVSSYHRPPMDIVSYDSSSMADSVAVLDDDELSLEEEFLIMPDGTRSQITEEMEI